MHSHNSSPAIPVESPTTHTAHDSHKATLAALSLGALGVVFGDIGTSPLYTLKECMTAAGGAAIGLYRGIVELPADVGRAGSDQGAAALGSL